MRVRVIAKCVALTRRTKIGDGSAHQRLHHFSLASPHLLRPLRLASPPFVNTAEMEQFLLEPEQRKFVLIQYSM